MDFSWVAQDDSNAIQNAIVDAKGDLIAASANDTPARLAVGANGETLVADSSTSTGLRYQSNFAAGKNKIINGAFDVWQRGTSFATNQYTADRFAAESDGSGTVTVTRQTFTPGTAPASPYEATYFLQSAVSVVGTSTYHRIYQRIEDVRTFAGAPVTLSFWARLDSGTVGSAYFRFNQVFGSGGSAAINGAANNITLTSSWQRFTATITPGSMSGKTIGTNSYVTFDVVIPFTATNTVQVWGFQAEAGNTATAFQTATGTLQGELDACNRYYQRWNIASFSKIGTGVTYDATNIFAVVVPMKTNMRVAPSLATAGLAAFDGSGTYTATIGNNLSTANNICMDLVVTGAVALRFQQVGGNNTANAYFEASAEL
jgi:hypothetical protein